jgi:kynurenine formamidase
VTDMTKPSIGTVRELGAEISNWGRWGNDDQLGTLNHIQDADRVSASSLVRTGEVLSLAIPLGASGPQNARSGRFNPIHFMSVDGRDFTTPNSREQDPRRGYLQNADDVLILPLQAATQWDGLAHVFFDQQMYNGYPASYVSSSGARRNAITNGCGSMAGRGVLLDLPRVLGLRHLEPGFAIEAEQLDAACQAQSVEVRPGDFLLIRTGHMARAREGGGWGDYAGGDAPGLGLGSVRWLAEREIAAVATDTWDVEVRPVQTPDVAQPVHILLIVMLGLWIGEIFDLEALSERCADTNRYEFLFVGSPLPVEGGIGSPVNPVVIL